LQNLAYDMEQGKTSPAAKLVLLCTCASMCLQTLHRTIFSVAIVPMSSQLMLSARQEAALLSSCSLAGFALTNVPGGALADRVGGTRVLLGSVALWSLSVAALPLALRFSDPLPALYLARFLFGFASGVSLPAANAAAAKWLPPGRLSSGISLIFMFFSAGSALGFLLGSWISVLGWPVVFYLSGAVGLAWSALATLLLLQNPSTRAELVGGLISRERPCSSSSSASGSPSLVRLSSRVLKQVACLAWVHSTVNVGYFMMQSWLPRYLTGELGIELSKSGGLSALPWCMIALFSAVAGSLAERLRARGWSSWSVRRFMLCISNLVPAVCLVLLAGVHDARAATLLLMVLLAAKAFNCIGYYAHVSEVAQGCAGLLLGFTNGVGIVVSLVANIITATLVERTGSFYLPFRLTALFYVTGAAVFCLVMPAGKLNEAPKEGP